LGGRKKENLSAVFSQEHTQMRYFHNYKSILISLYHLSY
jgi:hypothetical protein